MSSIADILATVRLDLETGTFEIQALKAAEKAGDSAGVQMSNSLNAKLRKGLGDFGTGIFQGMGQQAFRGIEDIVGKIVNAIPNLIASGQAYATTIHDIQELTNGTARETSIFVGILESLGISTDGVTAKFGVLSTQVTTNQAYWDKLGIATKDANDIQLNGIQILENAREVLGKMTSAEERNAAAKKLLGRAGLEFVDYLKLSDPQVAALTERLVAYGLVLSQDLVDSAKQSIYQQKQLDLAFTGLGVTLFTVVGPIVRTTMDNIARWVADNGGTIREVIASIASAISGLISGLTGIDMSGMSTFSAEVMALGGGENSRLGELTTAQEKATTVVETAQAAYDGLTKATKADTSAVDANIASVDRQVAAIDKRESAQQAAYEKSMGRLGTELDAQLALMDAQERALQVARDEQDAALAVDAAREALRKERAKGATGEYDPAAVQAAQRDLDRALAAQTDARAQRDRDAKRAAIESTKAYVDSVLALEKDATNRTALAKTLANRETLLSSRLAAATAKGDTEEAARIAVQLEAVKTTEARNQAALRNASQKTELEKTKTQLEALKKSITDAFAATDPAVEEARKALQKAKDDLASVDAAVKSLYEHAALRNSLAPGASAKPALGANGGFATAFSEAFTAAKVSGEAFRAFITDTLGGAIQGVIDLMPKITAGLDGIGKWMVDNKGTVELLLVLSGNPALIALGLGMSAASLNDVGTWSPIEDWLGLTKNRPKPAGPPVPGSDAYYPPGKWVPPKAAGGWIPPGMSAYVGEAGREVATATAGGGTWITPMGGGGGAAHVLHVYLDRREIALALDEELAYRPAR